LSRGKRLRRRTEDSDFRRKGKERSTMRKKNCGRRR